MTSYERFKKWKAKFTRDEWRAYCRDHYRKNTEKVLARNKRWQESLDPEVRRERNRNTYLKNRSEIQERSKQWRLENPERYKKYLLEWRLKNPDHKRTYVEKNREKIDEQMREWRLKNPDRIAKQARQCKLKNQDKIRAQHRLWRFNNRSKRSEAQAKRRVVTVGDLTEIEKVYERAWWWRKWFAVVVDHVIPLSKGGSHEAKNLQIIYDFENARKAARLDYKPRVIFA